VTSTYKNKIISKKEKYQKCKGQSNITSNLTNFRPASTEYEELSSGLGRNGASSKIQMID
jgi:hypothetical protein